jgi:hypothetical protein
MTKPYRTRFVLSLLVLACTLTLQVAPALAQRCSESTIIDQRTGDRRVCEVCCRRNGDCEITCR